MEFSRCRGAAGHIRDCDVHDRCVRGPHPRSTVQVCLDCPDYQPSPNPPAEASAARHRGDGPPAAEGASAR